MKHRALIVEDDPDIAESVADTLDSLGHEHAWARSQEEARGHITDGGFTYVLLDLQIPVRHDRGLACVEYGEHLAREIHQSRTMRDVPMIAMTAHGSEGFAIAGRLFEHGVKDCISKPFPRSGRTLAVVIESVLHRAYAPQEPEKTPKAATEPFEGGELVFYRDRAELCGVTIANASRSSQVWTILTTLNETLANGRYRAFSGNELAAKISRAAGQGSIAGSIRDFRRSVAETLGRELGLKLESEDVIETNHGYRFKAWITTKDMRVTQSPGNDVGRTNSDGDRLNGEADNRLTYRRDQIVALIESGERLRVPGFAVKLKCSAKSVTRAMDELRAEGRVEFVGASRTGYYRLTDTVPV